MFDSTEHAILVEQSRYDHRITVIRAIPTDRRLGRRRLALIVKSKKYPGKWQVRRLGNHSPKRVPHSVSTCNTYLSAVTLGCEWAARLLILEKMDREVEA